MVILFILGKHALNLTLDEAGTEDNSDIETEEAGSHPVPYSFYRTSIGSPSINRRSFTDEEIDRFIRKFPFHFPRFDCRVDSL